VSPSLSPSLGVQIWKLARRSIARTLRQPVIWLPNIFFGLFMMAIISGAGDQVTKIKQFPTNSYLSFVLGAILVQAAASASTMAGNALGSDIATGFLSRLALTPVRSWGLMAAQLGGVAVLGVAQAVLFLGVGLAAGASVEAGVGGAVALIGVILLMILAFGSIGLLVAVRTGKPESVQTLFALFLGLLFMSSMVMPRNLIQEDWFKFIATYNPMSYLVEASRSLLISGWDAEALALGCGIAAGALILALTAASVTLRGRIVGQ
jgi:ABC-2 type transport system permease protein